ncbi:MAG TPA: glycoside hydrolase domain-containing protein, partial [Phycisphaerae bacterium]|nr:glycoside hydrolase domain-containing protein [Phycisphaerae bacterium]
RDFRPDGVWWFRYPIYDLLPEYPGAGRGPGPDARHFVVYQWGGQDAGVFVNAIGGDARPVKDPPAPPRLPPAAKGTSALVIGDKAAGLCFDELVISDSPRTENEIRDLYVSYLTGRYQAPRPRINVTEHAGPPIRIDGKLDEAEWSKASILGGLHMVNSRKLIPYETSFYFTYDKDRFYIAMRSFADYPLGAQALARDPDREWFMVCMDDCMEVLLMPYESINYDYFHFLGNSKDYYADQLGTVESWDGGWEYKTRVAGGVWTAELAIPYENMSSQDNKARYPGDGRQRWRFNVCRNWNGALPEHWCNLCFLSNYGDFWKFGQMSFEARGVSPRYQGISADGDALRVKLEIVNTSPAPRQVIAYATAVEAILPFSEAKAAVLVPANGRKEVEVRLPLKGKEAAWIEWGVTDAKTGEHLLRGAGRYPFEKGSAEEYTRRVAAEDKKRQELEAKAPGGEAPKEDEPAKPAADDTILWPTVEAVDKAMEKRLKWKNNTIGISEKVPPPWSPVETDGEKVKVWGRTYDFSDSLILAQANVKGRDMLAGPVALVLEKDGRQTRYEKAAARVVSKKPRRVDLLAVGGDEKLTVSAATWVEFDGCVWVEMKLLPHRKIEFDRMWLEIPYVADRARNYNYWIDKESGSDAGELGEGGLALTYRPYVWLGDVEAGLCWWNCETREWFIEDPERTEIIRVIPPGKRPQGGRATRLKIMISAKPNVLADTMALEFGLMGTPVRPMPRNWRLYDFFCGWSKLKGQFAQWGQGYFVKYPDDPEDMRNRLERYAEQSPYILPTPNCGSYFYTETNYRDGRQLPDWWLWGSEFAPFDARDAKFARQVWKKPSDPKFYAGGYTTAAPTREYTDLYLYNYRKLMTDFPRLRGIYMD